MVNSCIAATFCTYIFRDASLGFSAYQPHSREALSYEQHPSQRVPSGEKFRNEHGMTVIKDGMKQRKAQADALTLERSQRLVRKFPAASVLRPLRKTWRRTGSAPFALNPIVLTWVNAGAMVPPPLC